MRLPQGDAVNSPEYHTTWTELTLDFIAVTGVTPATLDYGCTNLENMSLSFMTATKRLFKHHGVRINDLSRRTRKLDEFNIGRCTGITARVSLIKPYYVYACLLHRMYVEPDPFAHKDRFKFVPFASNSPVLEIKFTCRRGVLANSSFQCTIDFVSALPIGVIKGQVKAKPRIADVRNS